MIMNKVKFQYTSSKQQEECVSPNAARNQFHHPRSTPRTSQQATQQRDDLPNARNSILVVGVVWSFHLNDHSQSYGTNGVIMVETLLVHLSSRHRWG